MKIIEMYYILVAFLGGLKKATIFAPDLLRKTTGFCFLPETKKALIPLGIRAFPNFAFSSCGADGTRTRDPMRDRHVF